MRLNTFHIRLLLWGWSFILGLLVILFLYSTGAIQTDFKLEAEKDAMRKLRAVEWLISQNEHVSDNKRFDAWAEKLGRELEIRITYIVNGTVIVDSQVPYDRISDMQDHSSRPEVREADQGLIGIKQRFSATLHKQMIYVAQHVKLGGQLPEGVLRVAVPTSLVRLRFDSLESKFKATFGLAMAVTVVLFFLLVRGVTGSISAFSNLAKRIGEGDYSGRIYSYPAREFRPLAVAINTMAENMQDHVKTIEGQRRQLAAMFESMQDGVMVLDMRGRLESYNTAFTRICPYVEKGVGKRPLEVLRSLELHDEIQNIIDNPEDGTTKIQIEPIDGAFFEVTLTPYRDHTGARKYIAVFHDVTEVKKGERAFRDFVANASHQLRTPLTSIKGYAETLMSMPPKDKAMGEKFLETIIKNVDQLNGAVTSMLVLAKTERLNKALPPSPVDSLEVLTKCFDLVASQARLKNITLENSLEKGKFVVMAQEEGLFHVFQNLLDNAVRVTGDGGRVRVSAEIFAGEVEFSVQDTGPGVGDSQKEKIFERFYRGDRNIVRHDGSAGLGLSICRQIVENLGGMIWVQDVEDGHGADFRFTMKLVADRDA